MVKLSFFSKTIKMMACVLVMGVATNVTAQVENSQQSADEVELIVTGDGTTKEQATLSALRSGLEQAFGTFVSSDTRILNDELVKDEIVSISTGNVRHYEYISEGLVGSKWIVNVRMTVSIGKLTEYVASKGASVELRGASTLVMNTKLKVINKKNAKKIMCSMEEQIIDLFSRCFDYEIQLQEPHSQYDGKLYMWPTIINIKANDNIAAVHHLIEQIDSIGTQYEIWGALLMHEFLLSLREKAISYIMGGMTIKDDFGTYKFKETMHKADDEIRYSLPFDEREVRPQYLAWIANQEKKWLKHQFDYIGDEEKTLLFAGGPTKTGWTRLAAFIYNYFHYADPFECYKNHAAPVHYHFWYNHDNRFFLPKKEPLWDYQVYSGVVDHGISLSQFSTKIITTTTPQKGECILSFPLTMLYSDEEMMQAKTISVQFEISDEQKKETKGKLKLPYIVH